MTPATIIAVLAAGALGAAARYLVARSFAPLPGDFPWAVLVVNVAGSAVGGAVLGLAQAGGVSADIRLVLLTGLCGGFTTFSTLSVETVQLVMEGKTRSAVLSVAGNLVLGTAVAAVAYALTVQA